MIKNDNNNSQSVKYIKVFKLLDTIYSYINDIVSNLYYEEYI